MSDTKGYLFTSLAPLALKVFLLGSQIHIIMGVCTLLYLLLMLKIGRNNFNSLKSQIIYRIEKENAQQQVVYSSKMAALGEMAAGMAHEVNNPLTAIYGHASLLRQQSHTNVDPEKLSEWLTIVDTNVLRISKIIQGLREFSQTGDHVEKKTCKVTSIVEKTLLLCREYLKENGTTVIINDIPLFLEVECRDIQVSQVLLNLITNASDAMANSQEKVIKISALVTSNGTEISVTDTGQGIQSDHKEKLFQPFFTTKDPDKGKGLGLSTSKGIMEAHGGSLYLDSFSPTTRFVLQFPKFL